MSGLFFYFGIIILGLIIGSFLNCVIYRLEKKRSFLKGRSFCPRCKHALNWLDLIPVFSFLALGGRCRYCHKKISYQYPLVEISTALLFLLAFKLHLPVFTYLIIPFLVIIFIYDQKHYLIPDKVVYPAIALALIFNFQSFPDYILSALGAAAFFLTIVLVSREKWMGLGDVKLAFLMGLILGWPEILIALFLAFATGAIIGVSLIAANRKSLKSAVPFGPFLVWGTLIALFWGQNIINWYVGLILR
jgi:prepilin signal peptidase PulO-like enzyme (type II secretory pathway)